jgi:glycosyltransferase involved in cell wall biosynthesis
MSDRSKPRVHWVSPLPPAETDIAHYTQRILPDLSARTDLILWTDAERWDRNLEQYCEVRRLDPDTITPKDFASAGTIRNAADPIFIHIGNSWVFHSGLLRLARRIPSIIVLHDLAIQELCYEAILNELFDKEAYLQDMELWHDDRGRDLATQLFDGKVRALDVASLAPGFELTLKNAIAVLAHTPAAFEAVRSKATTPAYLLDLPFQPHKRAPSPRRHTTGPLKFVQFGYIGPNRRLEQVLEALAPLRDEIPFEFDIMGNVWDPTHINDRIHALGLEECVKIRGFVEERQLDAALASAHLVFNLRYPTMGEASGSQLRIWNASAAAVVSDLGWYGSLPTETVFKISLDDERNDLQALVRRLAENREISHAIGAAGRTHLEQYHTPARYAEAIAYVASNFSKDARQALLGQAAHNALQHSVAGQELLRNVLAEID